MQSTGVLWSHLTILFIKQTTVFFTSKNFLVTFTINLFVTKCCVSLVRSAFGRQSYVVLPRRSWKKAFLASFKAKKVRWQMEDVWFWTFLSMGDRCCQQRAQTWALPISHESSFYPSAPLCLISDNLSLWLKFLSLSNLRERNSSVRLQWKEIWRLRIHKKYYICLAHW